METFNDQATFSDTDGEIFNAQDVLCTYLPDVVIGLRALKAMTSSLIAKIAIGIVIASLVKFKSNHCQK